MRLHIDYAGPYDGHWFSVIVDALAKWPEIYIMPSTTSSVTLNKLKECFARFGLPEVIVSDNGTQFTSHEFNDFCRLNGINHMTSPPYHPQSNGQAERFVDTFKRALLKSKGEEVTPDALQTFLQTYRNTPNPSSLPAQTPAERMFGRPLRSVLSLMRPSNSTPLNRNESMENQFNNRHGAVQREYKEFDSVYVRDYTIPNKPSWTSATVIERRGKVLYTVRAGSRIWRHLL